MAKKASFVALNRTIMMIPYDKTQRQPTIELPGGRGTNYHVPLSCKTIISSTIACLHWGTDSASETDLGKEVKIELTKARNEGDKPPYDTN